MFMECSVAGRFYGSEFVKCLIRVIRENLWLIPVEHDKLKFGGRLRRLMNG